MTMLDEPVSAKDSSREPSAATPKPSDNPLDAPEGPRPEAEEMMDAPEDEEMTGMEDATKGKDGEAAAGALDAAEQAKAAADEARLHFMEQTNIIILPSYSRWFDMHTIHKQERRALPEFFNGRNRSKTPAVYKDYRDFMVNTYRLNPGEYLTVTACRRNLAGDVCAIMRVHAFLEQWGLINYQVSCLVLILAALTTQVDPHTRPSNIGPPFTGHFRVEADTPRGLQPHQPAGPYDTALGSSYPKTARLASQQPNHSDLNLAIRRNIYDRNGKEIGPDAKDKSANGDTADGPAGSMDAKSALAKLKDPGPQYACHECGNDCTPVRYHKAKSAPGGAQGQAAAMTKFDICPTCFDDGRFPESTSRNDFIKVLGENQSMYDRERPWNDGELLRLLEGLETFDDDWNKIADYVETRTREECVLKFLQLEIEDSYMDEDVARHDAGATELSFLSNGRIPFDQTYNPVMGVIGFLTTLAEPEVAAAAAGKSIKELKRSLEKQIENASTASAAADAAEKGASPSADASGPELKSEDAMDIDHEASPKHTEPGQADGALQLGPLGKRPCATLPFALAAARASALASHEERHLTRLVSGAVNIELQKLQLKHSHFVDLENFLATERRDLERRRQQLFLERLAFQKRVKGLEDAARRVSMAVGGGLGVGLGVPAATGADAAVAALTDAIRAFGVSKGEERIRAKQPGAGAAGDEPIADGEKSFSRMEA